MPLALAARSASRFTPSGVRGEFVFRSTINGGSQIRRELGLHSVHPILTEIVVGCGLNVALSRNPFLASAKASCSV